MLENWFMIKYYYLQQISTEVQNAKYFGIIVDSTLDIAHVNQLIYTKKWWNGRFLEFIQNTGHKAKYIEKYV